MGGGEIPPRPKFNPITLIGKFDQQGVVVPGEIF